MTARLAQCLRCKAFTLLDTSGPVHWAADVSPLDQQGYLAAVVGRLALYAIEKRPDGSLKGRAASPGVVVPQWGPEGAQNGVQRLHGEHPCPVKDQRPVKPVGPPEAPPATPGAPEAGSHPHAAPAAAPPAPEPRSRAATANPRLSSYPVCGTCRRNIKHGEIYWGIQHGADWKWAEHEICP